jgi:hypothetical protein
MGWIIVGGKQTGKTTRLVNAVKKHNGILIVPTQQRARDLQVQHKLASWQVISWHEATSGNKLQGRDNPVFLDDTFSCLQNLIKNLKGLAIQIEKPLDEI